MVFEYGKWDFVLEPGREQIHLWREKRLKRMSARKSQVLYYLKVFNMEILHSFAQNINFMVLLQMVVAGLAVYIFQILNVSLDINVCLFVSPIVFPLAFCINTDFQRREKVLEDLACFKSSAMVWYFCMRDWKDAADLDDGWLRAVQSKVKSVLFHLQEYLLTCKSDHRKVILSALYEDFSDINQLIEKVRVSKLPANTAIISRAIHLLRMMCLAFERLRVVREYRSPRSIRSFNKVFIMFLPIILAPYFVHVGKESKTTWQPYCIAVLIAFVFSALQGAQDKLDDPFDGMSEDDINMDTIDELNCSLQQVMTRTFAIGRFRVSFSVPRPSPNPGSSFRQRRQSKLSVYEQPSGTERTSSRRKTSTNQRTRLATFSNSELDSIPTTPQPRPRWMGTPMFMSTMSRESGGKENSSPILPGIEEVNSCDDDKTHSADGHKGNYLVDDKEEDSLERFVNAFNSPGRVQVNDGDAQEANRVRYEDEHMPPPYNLQLPAGVQRSRSTTDSQPTKKRSVAHTTSAPATVIFEEPTDEDQWIEEDNEANVSNTSSDADSPPVNGSSPSSVIPSMDEDDQWDANERALESMLFEWQKVDAVLRKELLEH